MYYPDNYLVPVVDTFFCLLANCFLLFCSDLDMLIFPTLLDDIQRLNLKSVQSPNPVNIKFYNQCPLYSFTLILICTYMQVIKYFCTSRLEGKNN